MLSLLLVLSACKKEPGLPEGVPVDCYQVATAQNVFTVSGTAPYEWAYDDVAVDSTGLALTTHSGELSFSLSDGTEHIANHNGLQRYDGEQSLYRAVGVQLERSDDLGVTWTTVNAPIPPVADLNRHNLSVRGSHALLWDQSNNDARGIQTSSDRGETWTPVRYPDPDNVLRSSLWTAAIADDGRIVVGRRGEGDGLLADILWTDDQGVTWNVLAEQIPGGEVEFGTDGRIWVAGLDGLFWSDDDTTLEGGRPVTELHGNDPNEGPTLGVLHLQPQSDGRMGFVSRNGLGTFDTEGLLGQAYCVAGTETTGSVVPVLDGGTVTPVFEPGRLTVGAQLPGADYDFAVVDDQIASIRVNSSFDATTFLISVDGEEVMDTHQDRPDGSAEGLVPISLTTHPATGNLIVALRATGNSPVDSNGEIWEVTGSGSYTGTRWIVAPFEGTRHFVSAAFPGPAGLMLVRTDAGVFDVNQPNTRLAAGGEMGIDPVLGDIFYQDGDWLARSTSGSTGVYSGRCDAATESSQDCYSLDLGPDRYVASLAVGTDRFVYLNTSTSIVRRPIDDPSIGWETVADGFGQPGRLEIDDYDGDTRIWVNDAGVVWAGVIGDTLPLTR